MSRPAGMSDDEEDSDFETFDFRPIRRQTNVQQRERSPDEKLFDAIYRKDTTGVTAALAEGANVHCRLKDFTPIMQAAFDGHYDLTELLIQNGANVNDDYTMTTVMMCICMSWSKEEEELLKCLKLVLDHGADPNVTNWTLVTPLLHAVKHNHVLLVSHLLGLGCKVNGTDSDGRSPIMYAAQNNNLDMVKLLLDAGANPNVLDLKGNGLIDLPEVCSNPELAAALGIEIDNDEAKEERIYLSPYKKVMLSMPKKTDRLYGFHEDAVKIMWGSGMYDIVKMFEDNNVQLAELLTWDDDDWKKAGLHISYYSRKIGLYVKKYHERPWGKGAFPKVNTLLHNDQVDLFNVVRFFMDLLRVVHISSATSLYMLKNCPDPLDDEALEQTDQILRLNSIATSQLDNLRKMVINIESSANVTPPDLITPLDHIEKKYGFGPIAFVFNLYLSWRLPMFSDLQF